MTRTARRPDRISIRVSPQAKRKLEQAAAYADKTLTDFITDIALREADALVRENEVITLTPDEWERFQEMLISPSEPNERLQRAFAEHARIVRK